MERILSKRSKAMKKFLKVVIPLLLAAAILVSIGWYFLEYNTAFTRDILMQQASRLEHSGHHNTAVWLYNMAYALSGDNDEVAIALAEQFKAIGNYTKAEYTLSKAIEDGGSVELYIALCNTYVEQNKLRDAVLMLEKVSDPAIKAELEALRPAAPDVNFDSGTYTQYISLEFTSPEGTIYVSTTGDYPSTVTDAHTQAIALSSGTTTVFAVSVNELGLVSPLSVYSYNIGNVVEEVHFADSTVEEAVRAQLGYGTERKIYSNELWTITELTLPTQITTCADLAWMINLESLTICGGDFNGLEALAGLVKLHTVSIADCRITAGDLSTLASLPELQNLTLRDCGISSIENLSGAAGLKYLDLRNNAIRDISPLSGMAQLQQLDLRSNALINLADIAHLTSLEKLDVSYNSLATTAHVAQLTNLTHLDVSCNGLMMLEGIDTLVNLTSFAASENNLIDVDILQTCTALKWLDVSYNTLLNIDVAAKLTQLEELDFSNNEVTSLPKFQTNCALRVINGAYNALTSLDNLSGLDNLSYVYMDHNATLSNVDSLRHCENLVEVHVYGTKVRNVSKLTEKGILVKYTPA